METKQRPTVNKYIPLQEIAYVLLTDKMSRHGYLAARKAIHAWQRSVLGFPYPLHTSAHLEDNMKFIDKQLTVEEMEQAEEWYPDDTSDFLAMVNDLLEEGYRVTFTYDFKNLCFVVTIIGKSLDNLNSGLALSTRHGTITKALHLSLYKHVVCFEGGKWGSAGPESNFG